MIAKVLRKLGLGHAAYALAAPFYSMKYGKTAGDDVQAALELLHETSADVGSSCHIPARDETAEGGAKLDIIIPAYNVERYIAQCVESVLNQSSTYSFRLIVIDDGSTDSTGAVLDTYEGITVVHQKNRGFSGARNRGLELATAEYLMFLDSDDCLCPGAVERLMSAAVENDAAIVEGAYTEVNAEGTLIRSHSHRSGRLDPVEDCDGYIWGKVIKRELFSELVFPKDYWYQDSLVRQIILALAKQKKFTVWGIEDSIVLYRQNPGGITKKSRSRSKSLDSLYLMMSLFEDRKQYGLKLTEEYYDYILRMAVQTYSRTRLQSGEVKRAVFTVYADFVERNFAGFRTGDKKLEPLEKTILERDYGRYLAYCELH